MTTFKLYHCVADASTPSSSRSPDRTSPKMVLQDITAYIKGFIPSAQLICETQHEFSYILPKKNSQKGALKKLFASLEANKESLACQSFGLTDTTLEEVGLFVEVKQRIFC